MVVVTLSYTFYIPHNNEVLQSFAKINHITDFSVHPYISKADVTYQIQVGSWQCVPHYHMQCVPPISYLPWYIWTKEGFKINKKNKTGIHQQ